MKKLLAIAMMMFLAMNGIAQILNYDFSAECETGQTLYYRITSEEEHTVTLTFPYSTENPWFEGNYYQYHVMPQGELILPSIVKNNGINYFVNVIDNCAFCNCEELTGTLAIPEGIVSIGEGAFFSCGFSSIVIPRTINYIDPSAFRICSNRDSVVVDDNNPTYYSENNAIIKRDENTLVLACNTTTIPEYIENIGDYAFSGVGNGGDLIIPNSVKSIGERAFELCHFTGSLILSESLETIGYEAFRSSGLTGSLTIPNSVNEIGAGAFLSVSFTGTLTLPSSLSSIKGHTFAYTNFSGTLTIPNSATQIGSMAFYGADFSELVLGSSVETIGFDAFAECSNLSGTLHLPSSINSIGVSAFSHTSFSEIYSHNIVPPTLVNPSTFNGYDTSTPIHIPFGCTEAYQNAEGWSYFSNFIESELYLEGEWYYEIQNDDGTITYQHLECAADTTIGNERPKIIVRTNTIYDRDEISTEVTHEYVYERDGKVYWWNKDLEEFTTLYNLSAEAGDEWEIKVGTESILVHVDSVGVFDYDGENHRMLHISDAGNLFSGDIVVGYGHLTSFFPERLMNRGKGYRVEGLRCYWVEDALLYHTGDEDCDAIYSEIHGINNEDGPSTGPGTAGTFVVYPNPANNILFVETRLIASLPDQTYRITNLMGQTLLQGRISAETQQIDISTLPSGMYFISMGETTLKFVIR